MDENNIIELIDDETGESISFEHLATIEHDGAQYIVITEVTEEEEEDCEVIIMKIGQDQDGSDIYTAVDDEDEQQAVFEKFLDLVEQEGEE